MTLVPPVQFDEDSRMAMFARWLTGAVMPVLRRGTGAPSSQRLEGDGFALHEVKVGKSRELRLYVKHNGKARYFRAEDG